MKSGRTVIVMIRIKRAIYQTILCLLLGSVITTLQAQELKNEVFFVQHKWLPFYAFKKLGNGAIFQGNHKKRKYFEGWYFKMVARDGASTLSVIPGISLSNDGGEQHAFIQIIDGITAQTRYFSFPIDQFSFSKKEFAIKIANNTFSRDSILLDIQEHDCIISGKIKMTNTVEYTSDRCINSGIMGWYRFVPFMQCYHGVVSLTHNLNGRLIINREVHDFSGGKGYLEKDWGSSMPSSWIWMQSNHFRDTSSSFMLSIAEIPWLKKSFTGFLGFYYHDHRIEHFATYRSTKMHLEIDSTNQLKISIKNKKNSIVLRVRSNKTGLLKAPVEGAMDRRIPETINAFIHIMMFDGKGNLIVNDSTHIAGLEMVGDFRKLQGSFKTPF